MNTLPPLGARVLFPGDERTGPCKGVVTRHLPEKDRDGITLPVSGWRVCVKCDERPHHWPHPHDEFAVEVYKLTA